LESLVKSVITKENEATLHQEIKLENEIENEDIVMKCEENEDSTSTVAHVKEESNEVDVDAMVDASEDSKSQPPSESPKEDFTEGVKPTMLKHLFKTSATIAKVGLKYLKWRLTENPSLPTEHFLFLVSVKGNADMNNLAESFLLDTAELNRPIVSVMAYSSFGTLGPAIILNKYAYEIFLQNEKSMEAYAREIISTVKHNYIQESVIDIHSDTSNPDCIYFRFPRTSYFRLRTQLSIVDAIFHEHKYLVITMGNKLLREGITPKTYKHKLAANGMFYCDNWTSFKSRPIVDVIQRVGRICGTRPDNDPKPDIFMIHEVKSHFEVSK
jgi:hypothetical protein